HGSRIPGSRGRSGSASSVLLLHKGRTCGLFGVRRSYHTRHPVDGPRETPFLYSMHTWRRGHITPASEYRDEAAAIASERRRVAFGLAVSGRPAGHRLPGGHFLG